MRLNLYEHEYSYIENNKKMNRFKPLFLWRPTEPQWWITGFNGDINHPVAERLVVIGSIDFSEKPELYDALKKATLKDKDYRKNMFFDDDDNIKYKDEKNKEKKVWIIWWGADRSS
jgi:hypothetical protein